MGQDRDDNAARQRLRDNYTSILLAIYKIKGYTAPSDSQVGQQVTEALAGASPADLRSPETVNAAIIGHLTQLAERAAEADRPRNIHGAEAARLAQLGEQGLAGALGHKGYGEWQRARAEARIEARDQAARSSGERYAALPAAGDKVPTAVMSAYVQQYAGTGLARATVQSFAAVGLDRPLYNEFRKEGFTREQITDNAKDAKVLRFHGREDLKASQHAPTDLRKAAVAVEQAKTPDDKTVKQQHEAEIVRKYEALPESDRRKHDARRFIERLEHHGHRIRREHGAASPMRQQDAEIARDVGDKRSAIRTTQDKQAGKFGRIKTAGLSNTMMDSFRTAESNSSDKASASKSPAIKSPASPTQA